MKTVKMVFSVGREMKQSTRFGHGHWSHCTKRGIWNPSYTTYRAYQAAGVRPPEGASYWESPSPQSLQVFLLAFAGEETRST